MKLEEHHIIKYKFHTEEVDIELKNAFEFLQNNIDKFEVSPTHKHTTTFKNSQNITDEDIKNLISSISYSEELFTDKEVCLDNRDKKSYVYVYILKNQTIKNYSGLIYLRISLHNEIWSFHSTSEPKLDKLFKEPKKRRKNL